MRTVLALLRSRSGATAIEYAIVASMLGIVAAVSATAIGPRLLNLFALPLLAAP